MREKLVSLEQAVGIVKDGDQVVFVGGMDWTPMAAMRELARRGVRGLTAMGVVGGAMNLDFLLGAGVANTVETCSLGFEDYSRVAPNYDRLQKAGDIHMLDNT